MGHRGQLNMGANTKLRRAQEFIHPLRLLKALDACTQSLAVLENGRVLYSNCAFGKEVGIADSSHLRGQLVTDLLSQGLPHVGRLPTASSFQPKQIETCSPHLQPNESIIEVICSTRMKQLNSRDMSLPEQKATESARLLSSEIAHDFGNLITTILLYSDLLISGLEPNSRLRRHAEAIRTAGESGVSLVKELRSPFLNEVTSPLSWNQVVLDTSSFLTRWVGQTIEIRVGLAKTLGFIKIGVHRARQIIQNLVSNARDAMPTGGRITISTRNVTMRARKSNNQSQTTNWVDLVVTDTGGGIDEKDLAKVFNPFFTTKPSNQGTGVGLTIVRDVVNRAGGKVLIQTTLEKGTRVTVRMPRITGLVTI